MGELIFQSIDERTSATDSLDHRSFYQTQTGEGSLEFALLKSWRREFGADDNLSLHGRGLVWFV